MSDKKRLEEMKNGCLEGQHILFGTSWVSMPKESFDWLIQQAERVHELERKIERYREALKFYADDKSWEFDWLDDIRKSLIWQDYGEKARKALEGTE